MYCAWIYNVGYAVRPTNIYLQWYTEKDNSLPFPRNGGLCATIPVELFLPVMFHGDWLVEFSVYVYQEYTFRYSVIVFLVCGQYPASGDTNKGITSTELRHKY